MKKLAPFATIVVHPGPSHVDEILAVSMALASQGYTVPVYRREPSEDDLQNQEVLVLDVGQKLDNWANDYDHHQMERGTVECAFSLVATELGIEPQLRSYFPWFTTWRMIDSCGPFQWAKEFGVNWEAAKGLLSPVDDLVHEWWEEDHGQGMVDPALCARLLKQGQKILEAADKFEAFCRKVDAEGCLQEVEGVPVLITDPWFTAEESLAYADACMASKGVNGGVVVSRDNRGPGRAFFRRQDDERIDFSRCSGKEYCSFAHQGGFILKTKALDQGQVCEVIPDARVG